MPRFHFEVRGPQRFPDPEGVVLKSRAAARREAAKLAAALVRDYPETFAEGRSWRMCILDEAGEVVEDQEIEVGPEPRPNANDA
ncbi:DUF6894 family protein [Caulobacter sp. LARHSG274]